MVAAVCEKEGVEKGELKLYRDVASAFGRRDGLNLLNDDLIGGKVGKIYVEHADRLSRVRLSLDWLNTWPNKIEPQLRLWTAMRCR